MSRDEWFSTDYALRSAPFEPVTGCHWCNGTSPEDDGPCEKQSCQDAAEDDHRLARILSARKAADACVVARVRAMQMAARYIAEGDSPYSTRVVSCREQADAWASDAEGWARKARELSSVTVDAVEAAQ
ncbi:hypothetical protein [Brasilonema bromeliae]|uniref:Uncharacterized protein n=1 Tax=Brasilonema bromeliae SPC951 TaxID=385972 RepID=A0ABX1PDG1_9CYAN|nr:hypothetical protein [Brasilonema bromeliae]NMG22524.1 hypothetical protein [Brasilonema bromeliae SPC951]